MKKTIILIFLSSFCFSQNQAKSTISIASDNDLFATIIKDRYYTSGLFFSLNTVSKKKYKNQQKRIYHYKLGHHLYTPHKLTLESVELHDRPFAAFLYAEFGWTQALDNQIFKKTIQLGVLGPNAMGEELQNFIHSLYGFDRIEGWQHQIQNTIGINITGSYAKGFMAKNNKTDFNLTTDFSVGTVYNFLTIGFLGRVGFRELTSIDNSVLFSTALQVSKSEQKRKKESFLFYKPSLELMVYDATIQGGLFNDKSPFTSSINPIRFHLEAGMKFTTKKMNWGYSFHYKTNEKSDLRYDAGNVYGSILIEFLSF